MNVDGQPIPIIDNNLKIIGTIPFIDNLTLSHVPDYVNMNGYMGLTRIQSGIHHGELVIMYYDKGYPGRSYGEIITEKEAYKECLNRGKLDVAKEYELQITPVEREVI